MTRLGTREIPCKRLFMDKNMPEKKAYLAVTGSGELLYVTEELAGMTMLYGEITYYSISQSEFIRYVQKAKRNGKLQKALDLHWTTPQEIERLCR